MHPPPDAHGSAPHSLPQGRISRYLANKCSIASRIDCFMDATTSTFGEKMKEQVEERLRFYEEGVAPRKNISVMQVRSACARATSWAQQLQRRASQQFCSWLQERRVCACMRLSAARLALCRRPSSP